MHAESEHGSRPLRRRIVPLMLALIALAAPLSQALAQDYPSRPIRLVVGFPPGGSNDMVARIVAPRLAEALGTQVVVENRVGVSGVLGADAVAKAAPDGYTLLVASASPLVITPHTLTQFPFDTKRDLAAVNTVGLTPEAIAVGPGLDVKSLKELIARARSGQVTLSSSGPGGLPHLTIELLKEATKANIVHVPYKGAGPAVADTLGGHVNGIVMDLPPLYQLIKDGKLRALAVTSERRVGFLANIPTAQEEGLPSFSVTNWVGVLAPARTPQAVIDKLNAAIVKVVAEAQVKQQFEAIAVVPSAMESPAAFQKFVAGEFDRWGKVVKESGLQAK